jgi:hypothetical protein
MKAIEYLVNLMMSFLAGDTAAVDFAADFENYFLDHDDEIESADQEIYDVLNDLRCDFIEYFQPDEKIRTGEPYLLDEDQLKAAVKEHLGQINK